MITLKDYKDWLKGYEQVVKECEVQFEQANIVMPMIKQKIAELEKKELEEKQLLTENKNGE